MAAESVSFLSSFGCGSETLTSINTRADTSDARPSPQAPHKIGDCIGGKYEVSRILGGPGRSGMGIVYVVYASRDHNVYALKTFQDRFTKSDLQRDAFRQEALTWTRLERHPNIVQAYGVSEFSGRLYIALEYITPDPQDRNCLTQYLSVAAASFEQTAQWGIAFCRGMEHAFKRGVICHRDIKPDNVMITSDGTLKITDFGMAAALEVGSDGDGQTSAQLDKDGHASLALINVGKGIVCGTPGYIAPEVLRGEGATVQSDIFSFGVVLLQMATGTSVSPFYKRWRDAAVEGPPPLQGSLRSTFSSLWPIITKCLDPCAHSRYADFSQLRAELECVLRERTGKVSVPPSDTELNAAEWNGKATALAALGRLDGAVECYDRALAIEPQHPEVWSNKADALRKAGRLDEAVVCCDRALEINPQHATGWHSKGCALAALGRPRDALDCFDKVLDICSAESKKWADTAGVFERLGEPDTLLADPNETIARCNAALAISPTDPSLWYQKGVALKTLGYAVDALSCMDKALKLNPNDMGAQYNMAATLHDLNKPRHAEVWGNKAIMFELLGEMEQALPCIETALAIDPWCAESWYIKGNVLRELHRSPEALECYDRALELNPRLAAAWNNKGKLCHEMGRSQDVLPCFDRALELDPNDAETAFYMGVSLYYHGPPKQAISWFDRTLEINPRHAAAWFSKGNALNALGQSEQALICYDRAVALNPHYFEALANKGRTLADLDRPEEALDCYGRALEIQPTLAELWIRKGDAHAQLQELEEAVRCFDRALKSEPGNCGALCSMGAALADLGRNGEAAEVYRRFLSIAPPDSLVAIHVVQSRLRALEHP
jgi:tetratricopeptide (TPR) repeat protein